MGLTPTEPIIIIVAFVIGRNAFSDRKLVSNIIAQCNFIITLWTKNQISEVAYTNQRQKNMVKVHYCEFKL